MAIQHSFNQFAKKYNCDSLRIAQLQQDWPGVFSRFSIMDETAIVVGFNSKYPGEHIGFAVYEPYGSPDEYGCVRPRNWFFPNQVNMSEFSINLTTSIFDCEIYVFDETAIRDFFKNDFKFEWSTESFTHYDENDDVESVSPKTQWKPFKFDLYYDWEDFCSTDDDIIIESNVKDKYTNIPTDIKNLITFLQMDVSFYFILSGWDRHHCRKNYISQAAAVPRTLLTSHQLPVEYPKRSFDIMDSPYDADGNQDYDFNNRNYSLYNKTNYAQASWVQYKLTNTTNNTYYIDNSEVSNLTDFLYKQIKGWGKKVFHKTLYQHLLMNDSDNWQISIYLSTMLRISPAMHKDYSWQQPSVTTVDNGKHMPHWFSYGAVQPLDIVFSKQYPKDSLYGWQSLFPPLVTTSGNQTDDGSLVMDFHFPFNTDPEGSDVFRLRFFKDNQGTKEEIGSESYIAIGGLNDMTNQFDYGSFPENAEYLTLESVDYDGLGWVFVYSYDAQITSFCYNRITTENWDWNV